MSKYLRHKVDGTIYDWNPILARDTICEEVTEAEAYPERAPKAAKPEDTKPAKKKLAIAVPKQDIVFDDSDLREEASRGLP
tara:strand:+ start:5218 stop:5460 length:243 start_codon:yes stop_codon:yes gene_type:complete